MPTPKPPKGVTGPIWGASSALALNVVMLESTGTPGCRASSASKQATLNHVEESVPPTPVPQTEGRASETKAVSSRAGAVRAEPPRTRKRAAPIAAARTRDGEVFMAVNLYLSCVYVKFARLVDRVGHRCLESMRRWALSAA